MTTTEVTQATEATQLPQAETCSWTQLEMKCYRVMGTLQECEQCGARHKGSISSTIWVIAEGLDYSWGPATWTKVHVKLEDLIRRYMVILQCSEDEAKASLPKLERRIDWHAVKVPHCQDCFPRQAGWTSRQGFVEMQDGEMQDGEVKGFELPAILPGKITVHKGKVASENTPEQVRGRVTQQQQNKSGSKRAKPRGEQKATTPRRGPLGPLNDLRDLLKG